MLKKFIRGKGNSSGEYNFFNMEGQSYYALRNFWKFMAFVCYYVWLKLPKFIFYALSLSFSHHISFKIVLNNLWLVPKSALILLHNSEFPIAKEELLSLLRIVAWIEKESFIFLRKNQVYGLKKKIRIAFFVKNQFLRTGDEDQNKSRVLDLSR